EVRRDPLFGAVDVLDGDRPDAHWGSHPQGLFMTRAETFDQCAAPSGAKEDLYAIVWPWTQVPSLRPIRSRGSPSGGRSSSSSCRCSWWGSSACACGGGRARGSCG